MNRSSIKLLANVQSVSEEAANRVVALARESIARKGNFSMVLSGGSTPRMLYQLLAAEPRRSQVEWSKVEFYFGDERCVPPDHPDSNYGMAYEAMLSKLPTPSAQVHRMRGEIDPQHAAIEYGQLLKSKFGEGGPAPSRAEGADLVLLGIGDDGHTASLFPGTPALVEMNHRVVAQFVQKLNAWRITMTAPFINRAGTVMVLACGASKARRLHEVLRGPRDVLRLPIQLIDPVNGDLVWLLDAPAGGML